MDSPALLGLHAYIHTAAVLPARGLRLVHGSKVHNYFFTVFKCEVRGFPGGLAVENATNAGNAGSTPAPGRSHMLRGK